MALRIGQAVVICGLIMAFALSSGVGQTINVGSRVEAVGGNSLVELITTLPLNSSDFFVAIAGDFADYSTGLEVHWYWYRNTLNADFKTFTTSVVARRNISMILFDPPKVVRAVRNSNTVMLIHMDLQLRAQPINLLDTSFDLDTQSIMPWLDWDGSLSVLALPDNTFSVIFAVRNATKTCLFDLHINATGSPIADAQLLYCPYNSSANTSAQAWSDPTNGSIFYITASHASNIYATYKCDNAMSVGSVSCSSLTQATLLPVNQKSYGRRGLNSNAFFYAYTSTGSAVQVIAVDFVGGFSSVMTVPLSLGTTQRTIALVDSTQQNAVTMLVYDLAATKIWAFDLHWNASNKQVAYSPVANLTTAGLLPLTGMDIPASSLTSSIYGIASATTGPAAQGAIQFFGRAMCGDGLVFPEVGEECDSVPDCDTTTCKCLYGSQGGNRCNSLGTPIAPVAPVVPLSVPVSPPVAAPVTATTPADGQPESINSPVPSDNATNINANTPTSNDTPISTIVPAVVVPVVVVVAGVISLVILLQRRKKNKKSGISGSNPSSPKSDEVSLTTYLTVPSLAPQLGKDSNTLSGSDVTIDNPLVGAQSFEDLRSRKSVIASGDERMEIPYSELKFLREIGAGSFGKVFLGEWQKTRVAMKISSITSSDDFVREAELLINLRPHPNVVQVLGMSSDGVNVVMIMEFCDGGSLDNLVFDKNPTMQEKVHLLSGIARGIYHLHKNKIVHRDLAARNVLLSRGGEPKISDFGMSRKIEEATAHGTTKGTVGPIRWMAPECLQTAKYSTKSDVWSFGILCWEVLSGEEPHLNSDPLTIGVAIRDQGVTPVMNNEWDPALQSLMKDCWKLEPDQRPDFDEICERLSRLDE